MTEEPEPDLHPLLRSRWSPRTWDPAHAVSAAQVASLLEAARWAPSAGNSQPWSFVVARRGDDTHRRVVRHLARSSGAWAPDASLLVVNLCHLHVEGTDWEYSEFSAYDLGQAVAHMTLQAQAMGMHARQFRAFDRDGLTEEFGVAEHWQVMTMTAFGVVPAQAPVPRERRRTDDLLWRGPAAATSPGPARPNND